MRFKKKPPPRESTRDLVKWIEKEFEGEGRGEYPYRQPDGTRAKPTPSHWVLDGWWSEDGGNSDEVLFPHKHYRE